MSKPKPFQPVDPDWATAELQQRIGYQFRNVELARQALTHSSGANTRDHSNERLEFLGDALLGFATCDHLFRTYPLWQEGELTRVKSMVVSRETCSAWARALGIDELLMVGKGVGGTSQLPSSLLANALESIIAAIYLDGGIQPALEFLAERIRSRSAEAVLQQYESNYKSALQQVAQKQFGRPPSYVVVSESGPDHDKSFSVLVQIGSRRFEPGSGKSKKQAEQRAAGAALRQLELEQSRAEGSSTASVAANEADPTPDSGNSLAMEEN